MLISCFLYNSAVSTFFLLAVARLIIHIYLAGNHAIVQLAAPGCFFAEVPLKVGIRRDDIQALSGVLLPAASQNTGQLGRRRAGSSVL